MMLEHPLDHGVTCDPDAVSVGDEHRTFQHTGVFEPGSARHLSVSIQGEPPAEHRRGLAAPAGEDGGDTGSHRATALLQGTVTGNEWDVSDLHSGHIGDGVEPPGCSIKRNAEISGSGRALCCETRGAREHQEEHRRQPHPFVTRASALSRTSTAKSASWMVTHI